MGDLIIGILLVVLVIAILHNMKKNHDKYGACAYCSYARSGHCDHVGHKELDLAASEKKLNKTQMEILARHKRNYNSK
ncbi:MAG: FeoB-associated Cys-rich membrane protein [Oribacterium sp.]|jgi:hypothetical protein|nr:FeoB-associated Cys-rich membrane protein [Oribacterium sp.]